MNHMILTLLITNPWKPHCRSQGNLKQTIYCLFVFFFKIDSTISTTLELPARYWNKINTFFNKIYHVVPLIRLILMTYFLLSVQLWCELDWQLKDTPTLTEEGWVSVISPRGVWYYPLSDAKIKGIHAAWMTMSHFIIFCIKMKISREQWSEVEQFSAFAYCEQCKLFAQCRVQVI